MEVTRTDVLSVCRDLPNSHEFACHGKRPRIVSATYGAERQTGPRPLRELQPGPAAGRADARARVAPHAVPALPRRPARAAPRHDLVRARARDRAAAERGPRRLKPNEMFDPGGLHPRARGLAAPGSPFLRHHSGRSGRIITGRR